MTKKRLELTGQRFGRLYVVRFVGISDKKKSLWECQCDCGNTKVIDGGSLNSGYTSSCGCYAREVNKQSTTKHGMSRTKLYKAWTSMIQRCYKTYVKAYVNYGGRGIEVCDEWRNSFEEFYKWSINNGYKECEKLSLDRINTNKDYCPENCRWTTYIVQNNNKRDNRKIEINGIIKTPMEWCNEYNVLYTTFMGRLRKGWTGEDLIKSPIRNKKSN